MSNSTRIITAKQMRTFRARNSSVMKGLLDKGASPLMRRKVTQREFWTALRSDSKSREFGERGFTKKGITKFLGGLLENKGDRLTDRKVKKLADVMDIKRSKLYRAAAEVRVEQRQVEQQQKQMEAQNHQQEQIKNQQHQQKEAEIRSHISDIILKGHNRAHAAFTTGSGAAVNPGEIKHFFNNSSDTKKENNSHNINTNFETSNKNLRNAEKFFTHSSAIHGNKNNSNNLGHFKFLNNSQHDYASKEKDEIEDVKTRLASIQRKADNNNS